VADTYDYWNTICNTTVVLKKEILSRNGKVVLRPDTGDPVRIVTGYKGYDANADKNFCDADINLLQKQGYEVVKNKEVWCEIVPGPRQDSGHELKATKLTDAEVKGSIQCLWDIFGGTVSEQGYKVLDPHIGLIYGDSITIERAKEICEKLEKKGFASTNIVYGVGSYSFQYATRDTDGYAIKATWAQIDGEAFEIFKDPKTDDGTKKSARGLVAVFKDKDGEFYLKDRATWDELHNCEFQKVFSDGKLLIDDSLTNIRKRLSNYI
jgi:nicotinamide phosphoribosyltransferase